MFRELLTSAYTVSENYATKFGKILNFASNAASSVASVLGPVAQLAVGAVSAVAGAANGYINYHAAADDFREAFTQKIHDIAAPIQFRSKAIMRNYLEAKHGIAINNQIDIFLMENKFYSSTNMDIDYARCENILQLEFPEDLSVFKSSIMDACKYTNEFLTSDELISEKKSELQESLKKIVHGNIKRKFESEVIESIAGFLTRMFGNEVSKQVDKFVDDTVMRGKVKDYLKEEALRKELLKKQHEDYMKKQSESGRGTQQHTRDSKPTSSGTNNGKPKVASENTNSKTKNHKEFVPVIEPTLAPDALYSSKGYENYANAKYHELV